MRKDLIITSILLIFVAGVFYNNISIINENKEAYKTFSGLYDNCKDSYLNNYDDTIEVCQNALYYFKNNEEFMNFYSQSKTFGTDGINAMNKMIRKNEESNRNSYTSSNYSNSNSNTDTIKTLSTPNPTITSTPTATKSNLPFDYCSGKSGSEFQACLDSAYDNKRFEGYIKQCSDAVNIAGTKQLTISARNICSSSLTKISGNAVLYGDFDLETEKYALREVIKALDLLIANYPE